MGKIRVKQIDENIVEDKKPKKTTKGKVFKRDTKPTHPTSIHGRSARYKNIKKEIIDEAVAVKDAVGKMQRGATAKFVESVELHLNVEKIGLRVQVKLPYPLVSKKKILYITSDTAKANKVASTPDSVELVIKGEEAISEISNSGSAPDVDQIWADPGVMPHLAKIAKIIGPAGLMPNPKHGTLVNPADIAKKLKSLTEGNITLSTESKSPIIHGVIGKVNMTSLQLTANVNAVMHAFLPRAIQTAYITSTMGPSIQLKLN